MPKGVSIHWSDQHAEVLKEWIKKYPKGRTINLKQIEYEEPDKWKEIVAAGHKPGAIRDKARYILGHRKDYKKPQQKASLKSIKLPDGRYQCKTCGEVMMNKQALGGHYRYNCPGPSTTTQASTLTVTHTNSPSWKFCPNCAFPLTH